MLRVIAKTFSLFHSDQRAAVSIEYALIASFISIAFISSLTSTSGTVYNMYSEATEQIIEALAEEESA